MKSKRGYVVLVLTFIIVFSFFYYQFNFSKVGIYNKVSKQDGYVVTEIQKPITFTTFIKPEWFPQGSNKENKLNIELAKIGRVGIKIEKIIDRGDDIYFSFDDIPYIKYKEGEYLSSYVMNEDGAFTSYSLVDAFTVFASNSEVNIGQNGVGPDSKFGFCISKNDFETIKNGFTLVYKGSVYYKYTKN